MLILKILSENKTEKSGCLAEHGLSIYIETEEKTLLFDLGQSDIFIQNAKRVKADLTKVDAVIVSHAHFDHTQGMPSFCQINGTAPIYIQNEAFGRRYHLGEKGPRGENIGILWTKQQLEEFSGRLRLTEEPVFITPNIAVSGTMDRDPGFIPTEKFVVYDEHADYHEDNMAHEQILVIRQPEGLYIFSGCSHLGVIAAIRQANKLFPAHRIAGLIAGMHLYQTEEGKREAIIEEVLSYTPDFLLPLHCTGMAAICRIRSLIGERCILAGAGDVIDCQKTRTAL